MSKKHRVKPRLRKRTESIDMSVERGMILCPLFLETFGRERYRRIFVGENTTCSTQEAQEIVDFLCLHHVTPSKENIRRLVHGALIELL